MPERVLVRDRKASVKSAGSGSPVVRVLAGCVLIVSATRSCSNAPTGTSCDAEFAPADRSDAGPGRALVNIGGTEYRRLGVGAGGPVWLPGRQSVGGWRTE